MQFFSVESKLRISKYMTHKHIIQLQEGYAWTCHIPIWHDGTLTEVILQQDTEHNAAFLNAPRPWNSSSKNPLLPLEFQKGHLSWCMDIFWNCPICSCKLTNFSDADLHVVRLVYNTKHIIQLEEGYAWASHIPLKHDGTLTKVILQQDTEHNAVFLSRK